MNAIQKINQLNRQELENNVLDRGSWHYERRDTLYIYIGGIPTQLKEYDVLVIFSQYGVPTHVNLIKNEDTGELKGFGYLKYSDFRSCVLAIDNLNGIKLLDLHYLRVDHANYRIPRGKTEDDYKIDYSKYVDTKKAESKKIKLFGEINEKDVSDEVDELNDPILSMKNGHSKVQAADEEDDELKDPMLSMNRVHSKEQSVGKNDEDDLLDPMANFIDVAKSETRTKKRSHHDKDKTTKKKRHSKDKSKQVEDFLAGVFLKSNNA